MAAGIDAVELESSPLVNDHRTTRSSGIENNNRSTKSPAGGVPNRAGNGSLGLGYGRPSDAKERGRQHREPGGPQTHCPELRPAAWHVSPLRGSPASVHVHDEAVPPILP
jgi:hypothetical protein